MADIVLLKKKWQLTKFRIVTHIIMMLKEVDRVMLQKKRDNKIPYSLSISSFLQQLQFNKKTLQNCFIKHCFETSSLLFK